MWGAKQPARHDIQFCRGVRGAHEVSIIWTNTPMPCRWIRCVGPTLKGHPSCPLPFLFLKKFPTSARTNSATGDHWAHTSCFNSSFSRSFSDSMTPGNRAKFFAKTKGKYNCFGKPLQECKVSTSRLVKTRAVHTKQMDISHHSPTHTLTVPSIAPFATLNRWNLVYFFMNNYHSKAKSKSEIRKHINNLHEADE